MGSGNLSGDRLEAKAIAAFVEELERQAAENPSKLRVRRSGEKLTVEGEIDVDALVMVIVGSMEALDALLERNPRLSPIWPRR